MNKFDFQDSILKVMQQFQDTVSANDMSEVLIKTGSTAMFYMHSPDLAHFQILEWVNYIYNLVI